MGPILFVIRYLRDSVCFKINIIERLIAMGLMFVTTNSSLFYFDIMTLFLSFIWMNIP
jgi:hypothetical protein